jgi:hypothetical protein
LLGFPVARDVFWGDDSPSPDLHWADEQTSDFLAHLLADPPPELSVVLTYRGEEVSAGVRALTAKLPASLEGPAEAIPTPGGRPPVKPPDNPAGLADWAD